VLCVKNGACVCGEERRGRWGENDRSRWCEEVLSRWGDERRSRVVRKDFRVGVADRRRVAVRNVVRLRGDERRVQFCGDNGACVAVRERRSRRDDNYRGVGLSNGGVGLTKVQGTHWGAVGVGGWCGIVLAVRVPYLAGTVSVGGAG